MWSALLNSKSSSLDKSPRRSILNKPASPRNDDTARQYIHDLSDISSDDNDGNEQPDLKELNNGLNALAVVFPQVDIEVFREMLSTFTEESRLALVAQALLTNKMQWVQGRYRVASKDDSADQHMPTSNQRLVPLEATFRSNEYKAAVMNAFYAEFKSLSRSTVRAVLAEHNYSYTLTRPTLISLNAKTWRSSMSAIFSRDKKQASQSLEQHPLVVWQSSNRGSILPTLKTTHNAELDRELFLTFVEPLKRRYEEERKTIDHNLALKLNTMEAEECDALHDCECCYTSYTFEELAACDDGHFLCFECIKRTSTEAVFGQGWSRSIDVTKGTLRCFAPSSEDCSSSISRQLLEMALTEESGNRDILVKLDERLAMDTLLRTQLPLVRCPFCSYAEIDELYLPYAQRKWRLKRRGPFYLLTLACFILLVGMTPIILIALLASFAYLLLASSKLSPIDAFTNTFSNAIIRLHRKSQGLRFTCLSPTCARTSCISCQKPWIDIHICHESSLVALRTQIELAMSHAIKRTCPRCNTSFVKSSGCNKLTCVCGYQMCYVCRKDIGSGEGYRHFCEHFRPTGKEGCMSCNKCDLYRCEDDEVVVRKARVEAEKRWMEKEGKGVESGKVVKALRSEEASGWWDYLRWERVGQMDWEGVVDAVVEFWIE